MNQRSGRKPRPGVSGALGRDGAACLILIVGNPGRWQLIHAQSVPGSRPSERAVLAGLRELIDRDRQTCWKYRAAANGPRKPRQPALQLFWCFVEDLGQRLTRQYGEADIWILIGHQPPLDALAGRRLARDGELDVQVKIGQVKFSAPEGGSLFLKP